jgi:hypothetical protein
VTPIILPIWQLWGLTVGAFAFGVVGGLVVGFVFGGLAFGLLVRMEAA